MRVFLACTIRVKDRSKIKNCKYILESFYSGEKTCLLAMNSVEKDNFLLDSGAFSYINGQKCTKEIILEYLDRYIEFINKYDVKHFFELDVDKIFGIEFVEKMREKLESKTHKKCIPVWHKSRGIDYWKKMCDEYEYIAVGGFAIKDIKSKEYRLIKKMVDYAYYKGVKVHGLGFTKTRILENENWRFYSVDSSSWLSAVSRGQKMQIFKNGYMQNVNNEKRKIKAIIAKMVEFNFLEWCKYQKYMDKKKWR